MSGFQPLLWDKGHSQVKDEDSLSTGTRFIQLIKKMDLLYNNGIIMEALLISGPMISSVYFQPHLWALKD
jgi:hypothetical protein